jgi:hypothetical protein
MMKDGSNSKIGRQKKEKLKKPSTAFGRNDRRSNLDEAARYVVEGINRRKPDARASDMNVSSGNN